MNPTLDAFAPPEIRNRVVEAATKKAALRPDRCVALGVLAGGFIALGAIASLVAATGTADLGHGLQRLLVGAAFSIGLGLVVVAGAELFTGDNLMAMAWVDGRVTGRDIARTWGFALLGNILGSVGMAVAWWASDPSDNLVATLQSSVSAKTALLPLAAFARGVLCNVLVCLGVWCAFSCRGTGEKLLAVFLPVTVFVAAGFEHSVANVFLFAAAACLGELDLGGALQNLALVTLGNVVGGVGLVGLVYAWIYPRAS